ncbi:hypothetical protein [Polynucleobacter sp. es-MAR-4]|uniref:hypothetical protein n=1 Tax=Polynucleobacter sp. es-MAR-4 TaxID=1855655 RepID=UPI001C0C50D8|nr:hypothetical protein [Polynucleobacter sp. es-MAR-4]MBU3637352.1 hypothetical protein [Polynucleobacter sp. es-MAR-4]
MHKLLISLFLSTLAMGAYAQDARIAQLEKDVQDLKERVARLESPAAPTQPTSKQPVSADGWKSLTNWRALRKDMTPADVRSLLGEPVRLDGGSFANWYYSNRGVVTFYEDKVYMWQEPR